MGGRFRSLESMVTQAEFWRGKRVLVTGHTGFKGSWLTLWLRQLGADVYGFALDPEGDPSLFGQLDLSSVIDHCVGDVRDPAAIQDRVATVQPDAVFHLAAQSLVRRSYADPLLTWETNVMGTANVLNALRQLAKRCAAVIVTTDKVYDNLESTHAYRETDRLGGHDPYSSSKAACECAADSWRKAFFGSQAKVRIATARAGNVIGGGDWAEDRIVPDLARALAAGSPVTVRNPDAVRPWQHVLDPLSGYLLLAKALFESSDPTLESAFNFGPEEADARTVRELVESAFLHWPGEAMPPPAGQAPHEAKWLTLSSDKAHAVLGWKPRWRFTAAVEATVAWYRGLYEGNDPLDLTLADIGRFAGSAADSRVPHGADGQR